MRSVPTGYRFRQDGGSIEIGGPLEARGNRARIDVLAATNLTLLESGRLLADSGDGSPANIHLYAGEQLVLTNDSRVRFGNSSDRDRLTLEQPLVNGELPGAFPAGAVVRAWIVCECWFVWITTIWWRITSSH